MAFMNLPILSALSEKMQWHQTRQGLLAENVANADTPGYRGRDLASFDLEMASSSRASMATAATQPMHFSVSSSGATAPGAMRMNSFEITPEGNGVTLEDEMMKVTTNMMDYQATTSLYQKSMKVLRTALGRQA